MLIGLGLSTAALGATWRVPEDLPSLQAVVLLAANGDNILVGPGTWGGFSTSLRLTVRSTSGANSTTLTGLGDLINVSGGGDVTLSGFRLVPLGTRAVHVRANATAVLDNVIMRDVTLSHDGAFMKIAGGASVELWNSTIERVAIGNNKGVIELDGDLLVEDCTFDGNSATDGGFVYLASSSASLIVDGGSYTNGAATRGGAISSRAGAVTIRGGARFAGNQATTEGGALYAKEGGTVTIQDAWFSGNLAPAGGAVYIDTNSNGLTVTRSTFCANRATTGSGGAIYVDSPSLASTWTNDLFVENTATTAGGAIYLVKPVTATLTNNTFVGNGAGTSGGGAVRLTGTGSATLKNDVFAFSATGNGVVKDTVTGQATYDAWYQNTPAHQSGYTLDATHLIDANPLFAAYTANGDCSDDRLWPGLGSPLVDRGDTAIKDADGSRSDIGAYGGPGAITIADADGDGILATVDCNDNDAKIGLPSDWYTDGDADGWGTNRTTVCVAPAGASAVGGDCDDKAAAVHPGATEVCDGIDNNCVLGADEAGAVGSKAWYSDADTDGFGAASLGSSCARPAAATDVPGDCKDSDPAVNPAAIEVCNGVDDDCSGVVDGADAIDVRGWYVDGDKDGYGAGSKTLACTAPVGQVAANGDCKDTNALYHPGATELCTDTEDFNCDGSVANTDSDADGYAACKECDDDDEFTHPGATELCDGVDQDCDGVLPADELDADNDGYRACSGDCDDTEPNAFPSAPEVWYDGVDQACDGGDDFDRDGDGSPSDAYGGTDCDDGDPSVGPFADEIWYDGVDQDCDDKSDFDQDGDGDDVVSAGGTDCSDTEELVHAGAVETWYDGVDQNCDGKNDFDQDGDGYEATSVGGDDCDDTSSATFPGATDDPTDGIDSDCNGDDPDNDLDGDGFPGGQGGADCDDDDPSVHPDADDTPEDGVDQNCSGNDAEFQYVGGAPGTCGCATADGAGGALAMVALGLLAVRRRRP